MNKMKVLLATVCCLFVIGSAKAQFGKTVGSDVTIVWDGSPGYRPNTVFTIKINKSSTLFTHIFSSPGIYMPPSFMGNNAIGAIEGRVDNGGTGYSSFSTTFWNYYSNSMVIGQEYAHWIDDWNGKNWYLYSSKTSATVWHWRIGN